MENLIPTILFATLGIAILGVWFVVLRHHKKVLQLQTRIDELERDVRRANQAAQVHDENLHELRTGALGVGNRVKELAVTLEQTKEKVSELSNLDPDTRVYGKAARLVDSGASIEELMRECDLPRGEAELLFAVHQQKKQ